jgi:hypothetical protein
MGIIVNFTARTVEGFSAPPPAPGSYPVMINGENDVAIWFAGSGRVEGRESGVLGSTDRVTGDVLAEYWLSDDRWPRP